MAITLVGKPQNTTAAYNPVYFYFNSSNKSRTGFRYIVDVYVRQPNVGPLPGFSFRLVKRLRIPPRPGDGFCVAEISKTLQNFLTAENPNSLNGGPARDSFARYQLRIGEEYANVWTYDDYEFYGPGPADPWNAFVKVTTNPVGGWGTLVPHTFVVGDRININQQDGGALKPALDGVHNVVAVPDPYTVVIDVPWSDVNSGPAVKGDTTYADGRKTIFPNLFYLGGSGRFPTTSDNLQVWNGNILHQDFPNWTQGEITLGTTVPDNRPLITNSPDTFTVYEDTKQWFLSYSNYTDDSRRLFFETSDGKTAYHNLGSTVSEPFWRLPVGPLNANQITKVFTVGSGQLITANTQWYDVWTANASNVRTSQKYRFNIARDCQKWDRQQIIFLDRAGALGSFSFIYKTKETARIDRSDYKFLLGNLGPGTAPNRKWTYGAEDAGSKVTNVNIENEYEFNTAWLTQEESDYFQELLSSPLAYVTLPATNISPAGAYPVIITVNGSERKMVNSVKNVKYDIKVRLANTNLINW